ncbi:endonuclease III domain-containing protein, partial [Methanoculleus bourgensis]|uniref:endonuclease III domain-containing protein n=1 Tax=Methanoculleus bourgensis TaxID=83986 RepID=UPI003B9480BD
MYRRLLAHYPIVGGKRHFIDFDNPFESLILTILSAQTTDRAVNAIHDDLFSRYPTPEALARAEPEEVEPLIRSIGFHRSKARYIVGTARKLISDFGGEVPRTIAELQSLPGVGRKTANIVLSHAFGINVGIA